VNRLRRKSCVEEIRSTKSETNPNNRINVNDRNEVSKQDSVVGTFVLGI
jgi:hypothetical protein